MTAGKSGTNQSYQLPPDKAMSGRSYSAAHGKDIETFAQPSSFCQSCLEFSPS